jgi:hypothetical protein
MGDSARRETVTVWVPGELGNPGAITVESHDPCISAELKPLPFSNADFGHVNVANIVISINPRKAPERLSSRVTARSDRGEVEIPVVAFFAPPAAGRTLP